MRIESPSTADGAAMWSVAAASATLDLNSPYAYVLWCRDFAATSAVARIDDDVVGYVTGYRRPVDASVLFVWQVAVRDEHQGRGIAGQLLHHVLDAAHAQGARWLEATVTPDNEPSANLFAATARRWSAPLERGPLLSGDLFPDGHEPEDLLRIGPLVPPG